MILTIFVAQLQCFTPITKYAHVNNMLNVVERTIDLITISTDLAKILSGLTDYFKINKSYF